ncbi:FG-GAP repeat domain-containing protein [Paradesertivirga mongoliensis]|uniref:FG-GAP repeat domain-containing protein n=1 Tax=Paradesertivirga mongoliensis TaxID=2100740 RepID=A0ABW4ZK26_9SPHI|nr:VCBS repeat-containing protein [Pedobacter mongoliensis]
MKYLLVVFSVFACFGARAQKINNPVSMPGTIIIPASDFLDRNPKGNIISEAGFRSKWFFNNTAITLNSETNLITRINVPANGLYYLYVRSQGTKDAGFKVSVGDKVSAETFGTDTLRFQKAGTFQLKKGLTDIKITRIDPSPLVDVLVLSTNPNLREEDIKPYQLNPDVELIKEYKIPSSNAVKFGDINGDKKTDLAVLSSDWSMTVFDNSGQELWSWKAPAENARLRSEFEAPGVVWDFDKDGNAEVVHWRFLENKEWLVIADGRSGKEIRKTEWPTKALPHVYNNFRMAIAKLTKDSPNELVVFTDYGGGMNINAYRADLTPLWQHVETRKKDNLGHYIYPVDLNKDGIDEVLIGSLLLDAKGKEIWNRFDLLNDNHDHADSYKFADVDKDGKLDIVISNSETGVYAIKAMTKEIIWQSVAEHSQQIQVGDFLKGVAKPQIVVGGRTYGLKSSTEPRLSSQLFWFDNKGTLLSMWPNGYPLNGNPDFVLGNWKGKGKPQLFWYKFRIDENGEGDLYFPDGVFHMFDFTGRGAEEVITLSRGVLRVFGSKSASYSKDLKQDLNYLRTKVVNHTHY